MVSAQDYYPFGMLQPGRGVNVSGYRFGFNGKENDNEVKGEGGQQDYGMRVYDPRLGRFLSVDPITDKYPMLTPYQFASDRPIDGTDLDGLEWTKTETYNAKSGITNVHFSVKLQVVNDSKLFSDVANLKAEIERQFVDAFKNASDSKTNFSASIQVDLVDNTDKMNFGAIIGEGFNPDEEGPGYGSVAGQATPLNTQNNVFGVKGSVWIKAAGKLKIKGAEYIAQDIIHELIHTGLFAHPQDEENTAQDVDLIPTYETLPNGKTKFKTFILGPNAKLEKVLHNLMGDGRVRIDGKRIDEYEPDILKRGEVSTDQSKEISKQIDSDTEKKQ